MIMKEKDKIIKELKSEVSVIFAELEILSVKILYLGKTIPPDLQNAD